MTLVVAQFIQCTNTCQFPQGGTVFSYSCWNKMAFLIMVHSQCLFIWFHCLIREEALTPLWSLSVHHSSLAGCGPPTFCPAISPSVLVSEWAPALGQSSSCGHSPQVSPYRSAVSDVTAFHNASTALLHFHSAHQLNKNIGGKPAHFCRLHHSYPKMVMHSISHQESPTGWHIGAVVPTTLLSTALKPLTFCMKQVKQCKTIKNTHKWTAINQYHTGIGAG